VYYNINMNIRKCDIKNIISPYVKTERKIIYGKHY